MAEDRSDGSEVKDGAACVEDRSEQDVVLDGGCVINDGLIEGSRLGDVVGDLQEILSND